MGILTVLLFVIILGRSFDYVARIKVNVCVCFMYLCVFLYMYITVSCWHQERQPLLLSLSSS